VPIVAGGDDQQAIGFSLRIAAGRFAVEQGEDLLAGLAGTISSSICPILASARISGWNCPSAGDTTPMRV
jgi:hypothetical protein